MASLLPLTGLLGQRLAKHLLRRGSYHISKSRIDQFAILSASDAVDDLFTISSLSISEPLDHNTGQPFINSGIEPTTSNFALRFNVRSWWMDEAIKDNSIAHKLEFFLHSIFVTYMDSGAARENFDCHNLFRLSSTRYTNGTFEMDSYKKLALKIVTDNMMLKYLNGRENTKTSPNENFAREFFELFTIGKGPQIGVGDYTFYTEDDIVEAAKLLTGWVNRSRPIGQGGDPNYTDPETNIQTGDAVLNRHDLTDKTFSSAFDNTVITGAVDEADMWRELNDFVEMIFSKEATAKNICRKIYRYFVRGEITTEIETDIITPLSNTLFQNDYKISFAIKQLLKSEHFYDRDDSLATDEVIGRLIRSPFELMAHSMSFFNISVPDYLTDSTNHYDRWYRKTVYDVICKQAGMTILSPDSVAGYPAYYQAPQYARNWFNGATLIARYKQPEIFLTGNRILLSGNNGGVQLDIVDFIDTSGVCTDPSNANLLVSDLLSYLFPETPETTRFDYFLNIFLDGLSPINWMFEWQGYQNSGDNSAVKIPLETLFKAILSSQEYGVM